MRPTSISVLATSFQFNLKEEKERKRDFQHKFEQQRLSLENEKNHQQQGNINKPIYTYSPKSRHDKPTIFTLKRHQNMNNSTNIHKIGARQHILLDLMNTDNDSFDRSKLTKSTDTKIEDQGFSSTVNQQLTQSLNIDQLQDSTIKKFRQFSCEKQEWVDISLQESLMQKSPRNRSASGTLCDLKSLRLVQKSNRSETRKGLENSMQKLDEIEKQWQQYKQTSSISPRFKNKRKFSQIRSAEMTRKVSYKELNKEKKPILFGYKRKKSTQIDKINEKVISLLNATNHLRYSKVPYKIVDLNVFKSCANQNLDKHQIRNDSLTNNRYSILSDKSLNSIRCNSHKTLQEYDISADDIEEKSKQRYQVYTSKKTNYHIDLSTHKQQLCITEPDETLIKIDRSTINARNLKQIYQKKKIIPKFTAKPKKNALLFSKARQQILNSYSTEDSLTKEGRQNSNYLDIIQQYKALNYGQKKKKQSTSLFLKSSFSKKSSQIPTQLISMRSSVLKQSSKCEYYSNK